jgi:hypothetical protein
MPKELQTDSSIGQQLKSESFTPSATEGGTYIPRINVPPIVELSLGGAMQQRSPMGLDIEENLIPKDRFAMPKPISFSAGPRLRTKQFWEGTVIECDEKGFLARVTDRTNPANPDEMVSFSIEEISEGDMKLVAPGARFYWTIGTERSPAGQVSNVAFVNFRRAPRWNKVSFRKASDRAAKVRSLFDRE